MHEVTKNSKEVDKEAFYRAKVNELKKITCHCCNEQTGVYDCDGWQELILSVRELKVDETTSGIKFKENPEFSRRKVFCSEKCLIEYLGNELGKITQSQKSKEQSK